MSSAPVAMSRLACPPSSARPTKGPAIPITRIETPGAIPTIVCGTPNSSLIGPEKFPTIESTTPVEMNCATKATPTIRQPRKGPGEDAFAAPTVVELTSIDIS